MVLVSVIIPVYNGEKTIQETIQSVLNQTIMDFELIIINSASTDSTLEIISQFKDPRIQTYSYPKANVAVNRNRGLKYASGEFISFIDADDLWTKDKLADHCKALQENPQAVVAYSWTDAIDENSIFLRRCSRAQWSGDVYSKLLLSEFIGSGSNVTIRTKVLRELGGFDGSLTNTQDTDMWLKLAAKYHFVAIPKVQILYRVLPFSMSSNVVGQEKSNLLVIEKAFARTQASSFQHLKRHRLANLYKYLIYKALDVPPLLANLNPITLKYLCLIIKYDPYILFKPIIYKAFLKIIIILIFPNNVSNNLLQKFPHLANTSTLLGYIKFNI
ncbi:glycosyltransferase [Mastigocoleus testarum]|uniref:Glycosyl transferase family A n=1 Tax=Mastigocoleus testarum BC008 TaxID=371196 RepID=A0A0V7ZIV9_9CYAN|nr:glycosyltransferase [Mastigocoleus testarum]KST64316.1 glycosyl transferase family A [Mastigocoleus testarum BC008]KST64369.1 glycosyl transferase family A [Mastigocoleus testarum BC008]